VNEDVTDRNEGPWDITEVSAEQREGMLDLGSLLIPTTSGVEVQVQVDEQSGRISGVTLVCGSAAVQVQAFAAPKSSGIWDEVRGTLRGSIGSGGGIVDEAEGEFGPELRARVPQGAGGLQPARFVGVDGPRWFLRGVFLGAASGPKGTPATSAAFRSVVVRRGSDPMAPGDPLPLALPEASSPGNPAAPALNPFVRGPEITEIR
jgi:hypothetical protein